MNTQVLEARNIKTTLMTSDEQAAAIKISPSAIQHSRKLITALRISGTTSVAAEIEVTRLEVYHVVWCRDKVRGHP